ncbi:MAG: hypothetical protein K2X86_07700 [Cytophagaceae bacterium]|nr:hypothetical protein [Cytophagaceae bacterium]
MTKIYSYSMRLHFAAIFCFLLLFFYTGCEKKAEVAENSDTASVKNDTIIYLTDTTKLDSIHNDLIDNSTTNFAVDSTSQSSNGDEDDISLEISRKNPLLALVLVSRPHTYSGIALVINCISYITYYSILLSFLFLIISLIAKYIEPNTRKIILLLDSIALVCLIISRPSIWCDFLFGYWVAIGFIFTLTICDLYILRTIARQSNNRQ